MSNTPPEILSDSNIQDLVKFVLGGGAAGVLTMFGRAIWKARTGRMQAERARNTTLENQRVAAISERDEADTKRRRAMDEVSRLRGMLLERGIDPGGEIDLEQTVTKRRKPKTVRGSAAAE